MDKHLLYLAFGSNLGEKFKNIEIAYSEIEKRIGEIVSQSAFYITEPDGFESDNEFVNTVCAVSTDLSLHQVFKITQKIEKILGRTTKSQHQQYSDRLIDIDILMYDDLITETSNLKVPHAKFHERIFVLEPFAEIAPEVVHPVLDKSIWDLKEELIHSF